MEKIIRANIEYIVTAFNAGEMEEIAEYYAPQARIIEPDGTMISGQNQIRAYWQQFHDGYGELSMEIELFSNTEEEVIRAGTEHGIPDWKSSDVFFDPSRVYGYVWGTSQLKRHFQEGQYTSYAYFIQVWQRQPDGTYKILIDNSVPIPFPD